MHCGPQRRKLHSESPPRSRSVSRTPPRSRSASRERRRSNSCAREAANAWHSNLRQYEVERPRRGAPPPKCQINTRGHLQSKHDTFGTAVRSHSPARSHSPSRSTTSQNYAAMASRMHPNQTRPAHIIESRPAQILEEKVMMLSSGVAHDDVLDNNYSVGQMGLRASTGSTCASQVNNLTTPMLSFGATMPSGVTAQPLQILVPPATTSPLNRSLVTPVGDLQTAAPLWRHPVP